MKTAVTTKNFFREYDENFDYERETREFFALHSDTTLANFAYSLIANSYVNEYIDPHALASGMLEAAILFDDRMEAIYAIQAHFDTLNWIIVDSPIDF